MLSFEYNSFKSRLVVKFYPGDFADDFKLVRAVCSEVLYKRNPIMQLNPYEEIANPARVLYADISLADKEAITVDIYEQEGGPLPIDKISFKSLQKWAEDIRDYIKGEISKYHLFTGYMHIYEKLNKGA